MAEAPKTRSMSEFDYFSDDQEEGASSPGAALPHWIANSRSSVGESGAWRELSFCRWRSPGRPFGFFPT